MPTINEDLTWLADICGQANDNETRRRAQEALARIRAALADYTKLQTLGRKVAKLDDTEVHDPNFAMETMRSALGK